MNTPETSDEAGNPEPSEDSPPRPDLPGRRQEKKDMHIDDDAPPPEN